MEGQAGLAAAARSAKVLEVVARIGLFLRFNHSQFRASRLGCFGLFLGGLLILPGGHLSDFVELALFLFFEQLLNALSLVTAVGEVLLVDDLFFFVRPQVCHRVHLVHLVGY